jgi:hypothetical protein
MTASLRPRLRHPLPLRALFAPAAALLLAACATPQVQDYAAERPAFDFRHYFDGTVTAHGMLTDWHGRVTRRFVVTMNCAWQGDDGTLDEAFVFSDGEHQRRVWHVRRDASGRFVGRAGDVIGEADGEEAGDAFHWRYTLRIPTDGSTYDIGFDDWMFRVDDRTVLNRARMHKFGFTVGEITLAFSKPGGA